MAKSKPLFDNEKSLSMENPVSASNRMSLQKEVAFNGTDNVIGPLDTSDECIPTFEIHDLFSPKEVTNILLTPFGSSIQKRYSLENQDVDSPTITELRLGKTSSKIDPEVQDRLIEISGIYKHINAFLLELESKSKYSFTEILHSEDVLDQITIALTEYNGDKKKQLTALNLVKDYLKSASIKALDIFVDETSFLVLEYLKKPPIYYKLTFFSLPDKNKIRKHLKKTKYHLRTGQQLKDINWEFSLEECNKAYIVALNLRNLLPDSNEAKHRFSVILISLMSAATSVISFFLLLLESHS